jgi:hypothetical protein
VSQHKLLQEHIKSERKTHKPLHTLVVCGSLLNINILIKKKKQEEEEKLEGGRCGEAKKMGSQRRNKRRMSLHILAVSLSTQNTMVARAHILFYSYLCICVLQYDNRVYSRVVAVSTNQMRRG